MGLLIISTPTFEYTRENPNEHWKGRQYSEWELVKMGEADNTPGDAFDADWSKQHEGEL